jgi:hypothetical protein
MIELVDDLAAQIRHRVGGGGEQRGQQHDRGRPHGRDFRGREHGPADLDRGWRRALARRAARKGLGAGANRGPVARLRSKTGIGSQVVGADMVFVTAARWAAARNGERHRRSRAEWARLRLCVTRPSASRRRAKGRRGRQALRKVVNPLITIQPRLI